MPLKYKIVINFIDLSLQALLKILRQLTIGASIIIMVYKE